MIKLNIHIRFSFYLFIKLNSLYMHLLIYHQRFNAAAVELEKKRKSGMNISGSIDLGSGRSSRLARGRLIHSPPGSRSGLRASGSHLLPLFVPFLGLSPLLFLPWRRRLGERRRHFSRLRQALCRRRASSRYGRPYSFLLLCESETEHAEAIPRACYCRLMYCRRGDAVPGRWARQHCASSTSGLRW